MNLVRTKGGTFVHRADCHMARRGQAIPWTWADTVARADVLQTVLVNGYRTCAYCRPVGTLRGEVLR